MSIPNQGPNPLFDEMQKAAATHFMIPDIFYGGLFAFNVPGSALLLLDYNSGIY